MRSYEAAGHAIQSGVATEIAHRGVDHSSASPKHLRVGLDLRAADMKGLVDLLIEKGVFTEDEYVTAITKSANDEADTWTARISGMMGRRVCLM